MRDLISQIRKGLDNNMYYLSLYVSLTLPDICGAIESINGEASGDKYKKWFNDYVAQKYIDNFDGEDCYYFRCSLLHQGSSQHRKSKYKRVIFVEPTLSNGNIFHNNILEDALNIDVKIFCEDIINGVEAWLVKNENLDNYNKNNNKYMKRHPNGLSPYIVGIPVIS